MSTKKYLLDTDILIDYMKGKYALNEKIKSVGSASCCISEISQAELLYGAVKSGNFNKHFEKVKNLQGLFQAMPITNSLLRCGQECVRLEKLGTPFPDFDLLIAVTAVEHGMILVTGNEKHHSRVANIEIENWRKDAFNAFI